MMAVEDWFHEARRRYKVETLHNKIAIDNLSRDCITVSGENRQPIVMNKRIDQEVKGFKLKYECLARMN